MNDLLADRRKILPLLATAIVIAVGSFLIVVLTDDGTGSASAAPASGGTRVSIKDFKFAPATLEVTGRKVTWTNEDSAPHDASADGPGEGFATRTLQKGESQTVTVSPGTYAYVCTIHPFMKAKLVVK